MKEKKVIPAIIATTPEEVIERVKIRLNQNIVEKIEVIEGIKETPLMKQLTDLHEAGIDAVSPEELTGIIKNRRNI